METGSVNPGLMPLEAAAEQPSSPGTHQVEIADSGIHFASGNGRTALAIKADLAAGPVPDVIYRCYDSLLGQVLSSEHRHLWRVWHVLPQLELYDEFNQGRARAYGKHGIRAPGYPAATVLGSGGGGDCVMYALAGASAALHLENRRQCSAYRYPLPNGKQPPQFCRAVVAPWSEGERRMLLSGTASIVGHNSMHDGDLLMQLEEALLNVDAMATTAGMVSAMHANIYLREASATPELTSMARAAFPGAVLSLYHGELCRPELLVEIDGVWR